MRLGLFASHGGSNLQAILDACAAGVISATPVVVITNNSKSRAAQRATEAGVEVVHLSSATHADPAALDAAIAQTLLDRDVDLVALAGYMKRLGSQTIAHFEGRILNVHPGLLPEFGGPGMYGERVHAAVLAAGVAETGVTVHLVDEEYDHGPTVAQARVPVLPGDDVEALAARVLKQEHALYVSTLAAIASDFQRAAAKA